MGHTRLGWVPKTQQWSAVVANIIRPAVEVESQGGGTLLATDVGAIAGQALEATEAGLELAVTDDGLRHTFYLLTQLVLAARQADCQQRLEGCVLSASLPDLISRHRYCEPWLAGAARRFVGAVETGVTFCKEDG